MARYRKEVEAIAYTGDNLEEIRKILGKFYICTDGGRGVWYKRVTGYDSTGYLRPNRDILIKDTGCFYDDRTEEFLKKWEEVE